MEGIALTGQKANSGSAVLAWQKDIGEILRLRSRNLSKISMEDGIGPAISEESGTMGQLNFWEEKTIR